jgi:DNA-binding beta-propeller fold protein YncE
MKNIFRVSILCCLLLTLGSAQWLERQVVLGDTLGGITLTGGVVVNPISGKVYIESDPVQLFNPLTMERVRGPGDSGMVVFCPPNGKGYILGDSAVILDAAADTVTGTAALPFRPSMLAYSQTSNRVYLASQADSAELVVFDPSGDSVLETVDVGYVVTSLLWDSSQNRLYIGTRSDSGLLRVLDCADDSLIGDVRVVLNEVWVLALSTASHKLYCADSSDNEAVAVVSTDSLVCIDSIADVRRPPAMVYSPVTDRLYCIHRYGEDLSVVDCRTDTIRSEVDAYAATIVTSTLDGRAYIGQTEPGPVLVLDTNDVVVDSIAMPDAYRNYVGALVFQPDRNEVYGAMTSDYAFVIDASADSVTGLFDYTAYKPRQMIHNPAGNKLYLFDPLHDDVLVMDSTCSTVRHIPGGVINTSGVPVLDQILNRIYVADRGALRVIDCNSDSLVGTRSIGTTRRPVPVMVPYLGKLYIFDKTRNRYVYAYDCLRDTAVRLFMQYDEVPCAVYDPRSNRVFFACDRGPAVRALDPVSDSVVQTFSLTYRPRLGRMALNLDLGRLYYTAQGPNLMFTIDVMADSVISVESLPWDIDTMFLSRRLGKLFMCSRDTAAVLVFDCNRGAMVDTVDADFRYAGLLNDRNDKLYLRYGAVVDCRYDSVVAILPPGSSDPRCMAWDAINNRVFQANANWLYVYRDDLSGVDDRPVGPREQRCATIVRGVLSLPGAERGTPETRSVLLDMERRKDAARWGLLHPAASR